MKKIKLTLTIVCKDSTNIVDIVSDVQDGLLCDNVKKSIIEGEENGDDRGTWEFENTDFEK